MHLPTVLIGLLGLPANNCNPRQPAPSNYRAFNIGNCQAQLTFSRGKNVAVQWEFDAVYADGARVNHKPFRNFVNIAVSDPFYTIGYGNNYLTNRTQSQAFTSVHEFSNVCRNGAVPTAWIFYTTSANSACTSRDYRFTTGRISTVTGSRPAKTTFTARQINSAAEVEVSWSSVANAQSYNIFVQIPTRPYEDRSGYFVTDRGARFSSSTTRAVFPGVSGSRNAEEPRKVYVNVQGSNGVWSDTTSTTPINVRVS
ncbi:hypothetical protein Slin15195_G079390 [Septoria linicola]|uniref:Uncharacterized protein n=1 Tax=Septoria linicola TaxID=215465 RepID=A0A9Q9AT28_9PEZI|nr:hypothetical protein Slin14017_G040590 [Septoria linicola]USW54620.1 hypothetical protein Slin15195_G079390 [Septoria linicola]